MILATIRKHYPRAVMGANPLDGTFVLENTDKGPVITVWDAEAIGAAEPSHERLADLFIESETDDLYAYAADRRWQIETGGITVAGATIATDRDAQGMIAAAYQMAMAEPEETVLFKAASGWIEIDAAQMIAIGLAVGRHVRACFRKERAIGEGIAAGRTTDAAGIDAAFAAD